MELWKPIKNYENLYEVSNLGRIRSLERTVQQWNGQAYITYTKPGRIIRPSKSGRYARCWLSKDGNKEKVSVHRLVAEAFCEHPEGCDYVDHKNGRTRDNRANNLRWVTAEKNVQYACNRNKARRTKAHEQKFGKLGETTYKSGMKIENLETGLRFNTSKDAAKWLSTVTDTDGWADANIRRSCRSGGLHIVKGYHFKYI